MKVTIEKCKDEKVIPKCPQCLKEIETFLSVPLRGGWFNESNVVICPHCHVIIGYGKVNYF